MWLSIQYGWIHNWTLMSHKDKLGHELKAAGSQDLTRPIQRKIHLECCWCPGCQHQDLQRWLLLQLDCYPWSSPRRFLGFLLHPHLKEYSSLLEHLQPWQCEINTLKILPWTTGEEVSPCRSRLRSLSFLPASYSAASEDSSLDDSLEELSSDDEDLGDDDLEDDDPDDEDLEEDS